MFKEMFGDVRNRNGLILQRMADFHKPHIHGRPTHVAILRPEDQVVCRNCRSHLGRHMGKRKSIQELRERSPGAAVPRS